eukprot:scaffold61952_cov20-Tisochrysis_lutea.AAC.3
MSEAARTLFEQYMSALGSQDARWVVTHMVVSVAVLVVSVDMLSTAQRCFNSKLASMLATPLAVITTCIRALVHLSASWMGAQGCVVYPHAVIGGHFLDKCATAQCLFPSSERACVAFARPANKLRSILA